MKIIYPAVTSAQYIEMVKQYQKKAGQIYDEQYVQSQKKNNLLKVFAYGWLWVCCIVSTLSFSLGFVMPLAYSLLAASLSFIAVILLIWNPGERQRYQYQQQEKAVLKQFEQNCIGVSDERRYKNTVRLLQKLEQLQKQNITTIYHRIIIDNMTLNFELLDGTSVNIELPFSYKNLIIHDNLDFSVLDQKIN